MTISLSERVIHFLSGPEVGRIRFTFPEGPATMTINRAMYGRVAKAIKDHSIGIFPASDPALIPPGTSAIYQGSPAKGGTIFIRAGKSWGRDLEGDLVHECTHAGFDVDKLIGLTALTEEAAAYVAEALYYRMSHFSIPSSWVVQNVARPVADKLLHQFQLGNTPIPGIDPATFNALRAVIPLQAAYQGGPAATGGSYIHNG
jgi:hypothetical protein